VGGCPDRCWWSCGCGGVSLTSLPAFLVSGAVREAAHWKCKRFFMGPLKRYWRTAGLLSHMGHVHLQSDGSTPLHGASRRGCQDCVQLLLDRGAGVGIADVGRCAMKRGLVWCVARAADCSGVLCVLESIVWLTIVWLTRVTVSLAVMLSCIPVVSSMTWSSAGDCHVQKSGQTALHGASEEGHVECVRLLLDRGADVDVASVSGLFRARVHRVGWACGGCGKRG
jgi:hypothetical protein